MRLDPAQCRDQHRIVHFEVCREGIHIQLPAHQIASLRQERKTIAAEREEIIDRPSILSIQLNRFTKKKRYECEEITGSGQKIDRILNHE